MKDKNILLCVTGGIAVFKAAALTSKLTQSGANVKVMMSDSAQKFVTPLTFQALSRNDVYVDTFDEKDSKVIAHIDIADWADLILVAPATANIIGKLANGIADDMISTTILAATSPIWLAPAMNVHMYDHPAVQRNLKTLSLDGYSFIESQVGYLACGYVGRGRLEEPETIVERIKEHFSSTSKPLRGKRVMVTAGPTQERLDPVRFFTNRSTGKMGYAIAEAARELGANVTLISGPTSLNRPAGIECIQISTAHEMFEAVMTHYGDMDIVIKAAAVADYRPKFTHDHKMKKKEGTLSIEMERTIDILKTLGEKKDKQFLVGFAAESEQVAEYANKKLVTKNLDMIVANNVTEVGAGFGVETNKVSIYFKKGDSIELPMLSKKETAICILNEVIKFSEGREK